MARTKSGRMITEDIKNMTIAEYIEYEVEKKGIPRVMLNPILGVQDQQTLKEASNLKLYAMADLGAGVNVMPKSLFKHLNFADLKETRMVVKMVDMIKKAPLGIVENILVKIDKFLFHSNFELEGSQDDKVGSHLLENIVSGWHVCKPVRITLVDCEKDYKQWPTCNPDLSFCSGYDAIYGQKESGMLKQWICF
nr:hypothetical protein [Tanacetum cinerariifolium]GEZ64862.1 hypothetical protein [Tanacetum cinerariifolium]